MKRGLSKKVKIGSLVRYTDHYGEETVVNVGLVIDVDQKNGHVRVLESDGRTFITILECLELL